MVMMSFSEPNHVPLILDGRKAQTTRKPRKNPIKVGDTLQLYYKSRMVKGTCDNCIEIGDCSNGYHVTGFEGCNKWNNFFGTAKVTKIESFHELTNFDSNDLSKYALVLHDWAVKDGFKDFQEADEWFTYVHNPNWIMQDWDIIYFKGDWLK